MESYFSYRDEALGAHFASDAAPDPQNFRMHTHEKCELYCFLGGRGTYRIEGGSYPLSPGDILVMRPVEAHYIAIEPDVRYTRFAIHFDPSVIAAVDTGGRLLRPFTDRPAGTHNLYRQTDFEDPLCSLLLQRAMSPTADRRTLLRTCLFSLLGEIGRVFDKRPSAETAEAADDPILRYINRHIAEPLTLDALCHTFYISKPHLCRTFRRMTGTTVWDYITVKRLMNARQLLLSGVSPTEACVRCGFSDYSAFFRAYRKKFGISPSETGKEK